MDRFADLHGDIAARTRELARHPRAARRFFDKYQDPILFGTDAIPHEFDMSQQIFGDELYEIYYRFLGTEDEYFRPCAGMGWGKQGGVKPPHSKAHHALSWSVVSRRLMAIFAVRQMDEGSKSFPYFETAARLLGLGSAAGNWNRPAQTI